MTDPTVIDLLSDVDAYLCALHVHVARHDQIGADLTCGGCVLRDRIAAALPQLAAVPPADQTTDRAALRQRIAEVLTGAYLTAPDDSAIMEVLANEVLAVLPEPVDRAAVLRSAADRIDATREPFPIAVQNGITWATAELRRLAAEAQPVCAECGHPHAAHREGDDPVTPGTCGACEADDPDEAHHDFAGARQDGAQP